MESDNPIGAGNQQGRPPRKLTPDYVSGFVDGEGCFCVSIHPHPTVRYGTRWLIAPCFQVYQHSSNADILEQLKIFFGCGRVTAKGPNSNVKTFSIYRRSELESVVIPFFDASPLISEKRLDYLKFRTIVLAMQRGDHKEPTAYRRMVELAFTMNQRGKQRKYRLEQVLTEPSETARQVPTH